jgi:gliding motility-associated-like protein
VKREVIKDGGCKDDTIKYIYIDGIYAIFVPNAFSPNGDGINDEFFPKGVGIDPDNFTFYIFDRWGEIIWQGNNLDERWDGTARAKGGTEVVQEGVYVWKIITQKTTAGKNKKEYVGHVTLIK